MAKSRTGGENLTTVFNVFHYVKGSKDHPLNFSINEKFGFNEYDTNNELPLFNMSIKDIYMRLYSPVELSNNYQLGIIPDIQHPNASEKITRLIFNPGIPKNIDAPSSDNAYTKRRADIEKFNPNYTVYTEGTDDVILLRNVFFNKITTTIEMLSRYQNLIVNMILPSQLTEGTSENTLDPEQYEAPFISLVNSLDNHSAKYLALYAHLDHGGIFRRTINPGESDPNYWDPVRKHIVFDYNSVSYASSTTTPGRMERISFSVTFDPKLTNHGPETYVFNVYFTPDAFIREYEISFEKYKVYTFNDNNPGGSGSGLETFNKYDNDYANALNTTLGKRNTFDIDDRELKSNILDEFMEIISKGIYTNYTEYKTDRVSPYISPDGLSIIWDNSNKISQSFFVFHNQVKGFDLGLDVSKTAVKTYLLKLHEDNNCTHPTKYDDSFTPPKILTIGHGNSGQDIQIFLQNMYPNLFEASDIYIIPPTIDQLKSYDVGSAGSTETAGPADFIHPVTPYIMERMVKDQSYHNEKFVNFTIFTNPAVVTGDKMPIEVFYVGKWNTQIGTDVIRNTIDFPLLALEDGEIITPPYNPLTRIEGFKDYRQGIFASTGFADANVAAVDIFQFIIITLYNKCFEDSENATKTRLIRIAGVDITYNPSADGTANESRIAKFTLAKTRFNVLAITGKTFGSSIYSDGIV